MENDERQERRDRRREKERTRMVVHKVKSPRTGERLVKVATRQVLKRSAAKGAGQNARRAA
jgi:hypothetical protein